MSEKKNRKTEFHGRFIFQILVTVFAAIILVVLSVFFDDFLGNTTTLIILIISTSLLASMITIMYSKIFRQTPSTLRVSLLGYPNSGKTVYLTVLFNELLTKGDYDGIRFMTYGSETIERISLDFQALSIGKWLPPTPTEGVFYYHATANLSSYRKYKLEIGDYAGEKFKRELEENNNFLHKTEYFKYVSSSDILFLAVDVKAVLDDWEKGFYVSEVEKSIIATLTLMQENKNLGFNRKINFPGKSRTLCKL